MIKGTPELIAGRREQIINACENLYASMSFKEITLKQISDAVPFSRPTIYNYFQTKEEIFLALFEREYRRWNSDLDNLLNSYDHLSANMLSQEIARTLSARIQLLKLLSMNNYDMEAHSRKELLVSFKLAYGGSLDLFGKLLEKFCPSFTSEQRQRILYVFFPFMFGIYLYCEVTEKQKAAMNEAGVPFAYSTVYDLVYRCLMLLLSNHDDKELSETENEK